MPDRGRARATRRRTAESRSERVWLSRRTAQGRPSAGCDIWNAEDVTTGEPCHAYRARASRLLQTVRGLGYVAGLVPEGARRGELVLIEWADDRLVTHASAIAELARTCLVRWPGATRVLLRSERAPASDWWRPVLSWVRATPQDLVPPPHDVAVQLRRPRSEERGLVQRWLITAMEAAEPEFDAERALGSAEAIMSAPTTTIWVASVDDRTIGHSTTMSGQTDAVTGRRYAELVDVLVPEGPPGLSSLLAHRAVHSAWEEGCETWGHVLHVPGAEDRASRILGSLVDAGWTLDHRFYELASDLPPSAAR